MRSDEQSPGIIRGGSAWEPSWSVEIGPMIEKGAGLLSPNVWKQKELIELFEVWHEPERVAIRVDLRDGSFWFNGNLKFKPSLPPDTQYRLIWFRRMEKEMYTLDKDTTGSRCLFYGIGWQATIDGKNIKAGYLLHSDGKITEGLL